VRRLELRLHSVMGHMYAYCGHKISIKGDARPDVHFPTQFLFLKFIKPLYQRGSDTLESAPGRQVFKIKTE